MAQSYANYIRSEEDAEYSKYLTLAWACLLQAAISGRFEDRFAILWPDEVVVVYAIDNGGRAVELVRHVSPDEVEMFLEHYPDIVNELMVLMRPVTDVFGRLHRGDYESLRY